MKGFTFPLIFIAILGTAYSKVIKAEDTLENVDPFAIDGCWYETNPQDKHDTTFVCESTGGVLQVGDFDTPEKCQEQCVSMGEEACKFWAFKHIHTSAATCHALLECYRDTQNHCTPTIDDLATCASGPATCPTDCEKLNYVGGLNKAHWHCLHPGEDVHPYQDDKIPSGSICTAECPVWKSSSDQSSVTSVSAKCQANGTWEDPTPAVVPAIGKPSVDENPACPCDPIDIDPTTFVATGNEGAELYCTGEDGLGDLLIMKEKFTIDNMRNCIFMCDKQFVLETVCNQGTWTNEIKDCSDFYCWNKPALGDCGGSPP